MKAIFDSTTGQILTYTTDLQDHSLMMANWPNTDVVDIPFIPDRKEVWHYFIDLSTKELTKKTS